MRKTDTDREITLKRKIIDTLLILVFGVVMGVVSKALDEADMSGLPSFLQMLDLGNFFSRFAIWIFIAVCISVFSYSAKRAALNVFVFFAGMVTSYYMYSYFVAGFFPRIYAMIWFAITIVSPIPAFVCWYAKGEGKAGVFITALIFGVLLSQAVFILQGIRIANAMDLAVWLASLWVLRRDWKETGIAAALSIPVAILVQIFVPYWG